VALELVNALPGQVQLLGERAVRRSWLAQQQFGERRVASSGDADDQVLEEAEESGLRPRTIPGRAARVGVFQGTADGSPERDDVLCGQVSPAPVSRGEVIVSRSD
jgi:hypothetical protein